MTGVQTCALPIYPSEIIGSNPRPLDYSLYRAIITHRAWNQGIARIGFRKLEEDLMHRVGNKPYICLEYAFYSLIPQAVDEELALRLVRYYQDALRHNLTAHDKIEFEIVFTSYDFGTENRTRCLLEHGFTDPLPALGEFVGKNGRMDHGCCCVVKVIYWFVCRKMDFWS